MDNKLKYALFTPNKCLSEKAMFDYIDNKLTDKERHLVEKHLIDCPFCTDALEGLELLKNRNKISEVNEKINERVGLIVEKQTKIIPFNYKWVVSIAASFLLIIGSVYLFNHFTKREMNQNNLAELKSPSSLPPPPSDTEGKAVVLKPQENKEKSEKDESIKNEAIENRNANSLDVLQKGKHSSNIKKTGPSGTGNAIAADEVVTIKSLHDKNINNIALAANESKERSLDQQLVVIENEEKKLTYSGDTEGFYSMNKSSQPSKENQNSEDVNRLKDTENRDEENSYRLKADDKGKKESAVKRTEQKSAFAEPMATPQQNAEKGAINFKTNITTDVAGTISDSISVNSESLPSFPGGDDSLKKYIKTHFYYPSANYTWDISLGTKIYLEFTVKTNGNIINAKITKGINSVLDIEALRVVNNMTNWLPAKQNGKQISGKYNMVMQLETNPPLLTR